MHAHRDSALPGKAVLASVNRVGNFFDTVTNVLALSERQVEFVAQNVSNISTPGYKKYAPFNQIVDPIWTETGPIPDERASLDLSPGKLFGTGRAYDLAIAGRGFFVVATQAGVAYTRQGQFHLDGDGRLVNGDGFAVQLDGGGEVRTDGPGLTVQEDGTVLDGDTPVGKLAIVDFTNPAAVRMGRDGLLTAPDGDVSPLDTVSVRQGMLEASNVSMGSEMVSMMEALRRAEAGQRLMNVYDDLLGRALTVAGGA